jgi:uncharacterized OB-fold protein
VGEKKPTQYQDMFHFVTPGRRFNIVSLDPYVAEGRLVMPYRYFPGPTATRFFVELRDKRKIFGIRCKSCGTVYVPVETTCGRCFEKMEDWVEVGNQGVLESYTVTHYSLPLHPYTSPLIYGLVKLDGADTGIIHLLGEIDPDELDCGIRLEAVFREERKGDILDIKYFRPIHKGQAKG